MLVRGSLFDVTYAKGTGLCWECLVSASHMTRSWGDYMADIFAAPPMKRTCVVVQFPGWRAPGSRASYQRNDCAWLSLATPRGAFFYWTQLVLVRWVSSCRLLSGVLQFSSCVGRARGLWELTDDPNAYLACRTGGAGALCELSSRVPV